MAAWHGFVSHPLGLAFAAPGMPKADPQRNSPKPVDLHHGDKNYAA